MPEATWGGVWLVEKFIGCKVSSNSTTIDALAETYGEINFIKMDIEGYEQTALIGAQKYLHGAPAKSQMAICAYHTSTALDEIKYIIGETFSCEESKGYMAFPPFEIPTMRKGILRCRKN